MLFYRLPFFFVKTMFFEKKIQKYHQSVVVSTVLTQIRVQTVCKGYRRATLTCNNSFASAKLRLMTPILSDQVPENVSDFLPISGTIFTRQTECIQNEEIIHSLDTFPL